MADQQAKFPWLTKIQQESWQAEIILSGLIIFTLTQMPELIGNLFYVLGTRYIEFADLGMFEDFLVTGVYWLIAGFLVHLVLRGVWAGFVGLSYTFPAGIQKDKTQFAPRFQKIIDNMPSHEQSIITLDSAQIEIPDWRFHVHEPTSEYGLLGYLDISELPVGRHHLEIRYKKPPPFHRAPYIYADIPFYKTD